MLDLLKSDAGVSVHLTFLTEDGNHRVSIPAESEEWKEFTGAYIDEGFLIDFLTPEEYFEFVARNQ
jgi:ABC-2 type transport system ATP-binding protein